jgi:phosphoglycerate kinase
MKTIDDVDIEGRNIVLRTDLNLPIEEGEPQETVRFKRYLETIREISDKGGRTVVMAHQGRPARKDFLSLEEHAEILSENLDKEVKFVQTFFGPQLGDAIASMQDGDVVMLENIRFLSEELQNVGPERHSQDYFVQNMAKYFDLFVEDAFSAAHRSHGSIVGFMPLLETCAGKIMERELESCQKIRDDLDNPTLILGGEKPSDVIGMAKQMIDRVDKVLLGGVPGELALIIEGNQLGEKSDWIEEHGFDSGINELEELLDQHGDKIMIPDDVRSDSGNYEPSEVPENDMVWDIGESTRRKYVQTIEKADSILMKGPMGAFEDYEEGSKAIVDAVAMNTGFTVIGGGHTSSLVQRFNHDLDDFGHVSIAGGAFVRFMSGEDLAAVKALRNYS